MKYPPKQRERIVRSALQTETLFDLLALIGFWIFVLVGIFAVLKLVHSLIFIVRFKRVESKGPAPSIARFMRT
jgi:hypothetical protein